MPELSLCPIFTKMLTIIGAVSGIWGIITFFIQIKDDRKIKIFKRTAAFLLVGIICVVQELKEFLNSFYNEQENSDYWFDLG